MSIEKILYTKDSAAALIQRVGHEIVQRMGDISHNAPEAKARVLREIAREFLPQVEDAVALEVVSRHVQGVTFSVWAGPPGSGKGTNIDTAALLGSAYAEVVSQGGEGQLAEPFHSLLLQFSLSQGMVVTGTKGMFNRPEGEYAELFGELVPEFGKLVADGGFVPDDAVSVLVELMLLYRLVQGFHRIQIDLWPRTGPQFEAYQKLVAKIRAARGRVTNEVVVIKVISGENLVAVRQDPARIATASEVISKRINEEITSDWYTQELSRTLAIEDRGERYAAETEALGRLFRLLEGEFRDRASQIVIKELRIVCDRLAFRFKTMNDSGASIRPDEYPLSVIRRLSIYTGETAPAFLHAIADYGRRDGFYVVSSAGTPEEVIAEILETLAGSSSVDGNWIAIKKLAGEIAVNVVTRKTPIAEVLIERVGGILNSERLNAE